MKKSFVLFVLALLPLLVMGQVEPLCPICKKVVSKCQYKGNHPKPQPESQCPTCKNVISKCQYKGKHPKPQPESQCPTCKEAISKCQYKGKHPEPQPEPEAAGYDVTFYSNVEAATMSIDGVANGTPSGTRFLKTGSHTVRLTANDYEDYSQTITVNSSSRSFTLTMKKKENSLSPVLQNLVNNMVRVEGGTFMMGATSEQGSDAWKDEKPAHQVTLSSFSIGKYEVTQEEWEAVMGSNPSKFKGVKRPVERVSWDDCQEFIRKLNQKTGKHFRLPTEAEWEFAARGGNRSNGYKYSGSNDKRNVAWYNSHKKTHPVGQKSPNELGLYDMSGNVFEWCQDWYDSSYYDTSPSTNPVNNTSASRLVIRGGSWFEFARFCRVSNRSCVKHGFRGCNLGLRLAL
jgi:formylglycine-generating enzyme required for sulfatase activity